MSAIIDHAALYYPYIHIRDDNWLKATLLCFPSVERMVPPSYAVNDGETAAFFAGEKGRLGRPMLGRRDLDDPATEDARSKLLASLNEDLIPLGLAERFSRDAARTGPYKDGESAFQIHEYKLGGEKSKFLDFLQEYDLAWAPPNPVRGEATWWAVHPLLGEAIMSTNAVALARAHDLEIVTPDGPTHQALLGTTPADVYDILIRNRIFGVPRSETQKVNDMMRLVIVSAFDLEDVPLERIVELNKERRDIGALKAAILSEVSDVGAMPDREVWNDALATRAKDVVAAWEERASPLALFTKVDASDLVSEASGFLKEIAGPAAAGAAATSIVGALPGLVVGVAFGTIKLFQKWGEEKKPYRFLSRLERAGASQRHILEASPA
jgi:hypothetical protein